MARDFDGVDDVVNCGSSDLLDNMKSSGGFSLSAWLLPDNAGEGNLGIIAAKTLNNHLNGWQFRYRTVDGEVVFVHTGSSNVTRGTSTLLTFDTPHSVVVTWDGSVTAANIHIYLDGTEASYSTTSDGATLDSDAANNFTIGGTTNGSRDFDGAISEVAVWVGGAISASEIAALSRGVSPYLVRSQTLTLYLPMYGTGSPEPDFSGNGLNGTVTGTTIVDHPAVMPLRMSDYGWRGAFTAAVAGGDPEGPLIWGKLVGRGILGGRLEA